MKRNYEYTVNKKYGKLLIIRILNKDSSRKTIVECKCDCGNKKTLPVSRILDGEYKSCGCLRHRSGKDSPTFKGYEELNGTLWSQITTNAQRRGYKFDLSLEQVWNIFIEQNRKCALSGLELKIGNRHKMEETTASLDRIDSTKGYIPGNVQWVHKNINWMKQDFCQRDFIKYCKLVAKNNEITSNI
jgi:hypothetical protein